MENTGIDRAVVPAVLTATAIGDSCGHQQSEDHEDQADDSEASCNRVHVLCSLLVWKHSHVSAEPHLRWVFIWRSKRLTGDARAHGIGAAGLSSSALSDECGEKNLRIAHSNT